MIEWFLKIPLLQRSSFLSTRRTTFCFKFSENALNYFVPKYISGFLVSRCGIFRGGFLRLSRLEFLTNKFPVILVFSLDEVAEGMNK